VGDRNLLLGAGATSARPAVPRARRRRRAAPRASVPGRWAGVSGAPETVVKGETGVTGAPGSEPPRRGWGRPGAPTSRNDLYAASVTRCRESGNGYPAGGLCTRASQRPRWVRIFAMTAGCSMKAMMRIAPAQRGHTRGSTS
jgi:hypothetical protein